MARAATETSLLRKTLLTTGIMLGACVVFVGALTVVAVSMTGKSKSNATSSEEAALVPADRVHGAPALGAGLPNAAAKNVTLQKPITPANATVAPARARSNQF